MDVSDAMLSITGTGQMSTNWNGDEAVDTKLKCIPFLASYCSLNALHEHHVARASGWDALLSGKRA
jgi:hypothetical protein